MDLPGYGFAKVPDRVRALWAPMIEEFLLEDKLLRLNVLIVDGRHKPTALDQLMVEWLDENRIPAQVVATKIDKVPRNRRFKSLSLIKESLGVDNVIPFSATTGEGKKHIWRIIQNID